MSTSHQPLHYASLLSGAELHATEINALLQLSALLKRDRHKHIFKNVCKNKYLALIFDKLSLRTRFSFMIAMQELGGNAIESISHTRKNETPEDLMRVLQGYCDIVMIRTFEESILEKMQSVATIPLINGLSNLYHPCQILADLLTLQEKFNQLAQLTLTYIGDGNNILHSLLLMAPQLGIHLRYCCPSQRQPHATIVELAKQRAYPGSIQYYDNPQLAASNSQAIYTDVWTSMGYENNDDSLFTNFQVNEALMQHADKNAIFMHCMPMERGKEVSDTLPDQTCSVIFQQSENRLHVQKALLFTMIGENL